MFGAQQDPSRTEKASPKRVSKQREEGNVPKAPELGKAVSLLGGVAILYASIGPMADNIKRLFRRFLSHGTENALATSIILAMAHNVLTLHHKLQSGNFGTYLYSLKKVKKSA